MRRGVWSRHDSEVEVASGKAGEEGVAGQGTVSGEFVRGESADASGSEIKP